MIMLLIDLAWHQKAAAGKATVEFSDDASFLWSAALCEFRKFGALDVKRARAAYKEGGVAQPGERFDLVRIGTHPADCDRHE